jgi:hypothetical protein
MTSDVDGVFGGGDESGGVGFDDLGWVTAVLGVCGFEGCGVLEVVEGLVGDGGFVSDCGETGPALNSVFAPFSIVFEELNGPEACLAAS